MHTHPTVISHSEAIAAWQEVVDGAKEQPWLASQVARGGKPLLQRFLHFYQQLRVRRQWRRRLQRHWGASLAALALLLALSGGPATANPADVIVVDGVICTLGEAITSANNDNAAGNGCVNGNGADIIDLQVDVSLPNVLALPEIASAITLDGNGHTIQRTGGPTQSIIRVGAAGDLTLTEATISGGSALNGGGINNRGTLTVQNSVLSGNSATSVGGGISAVAPGALTLVQNSILTGNSATSQGGGIFGYYGTMVVENSTLTGNSANQGGGISCDSMYLTVQDSTLTSNSATTYGGGILGKCLLKVQGSILSGNAADRGGGIENGGPLLVQNSTFSSNTATINGGGIHSWSTVTVQNSTFSGNSANRGGGIDHDGPLLVQNSTFSSNSATTKGGGIHSGGMVTVQNSTLSGNWAGNDGGGIFNNFSATMNLENSTISTNSAVNGGGIFNYYGTLSVQNSTLSSNSATQGGGIHDAGAQATVQSSIVALQLAGGDCSSSVGSTGYNVESGTSCGFTEASSQQNVSSAQLNLGGLASNGGPTQTMALDAGSVAIDQIPMDVLEANGCGVTVTTDQRGAPRAGGTATTGGNACDVGAFEFASAPLAATLASFDAQAQADRVLVTWETVSEVNNAGFNLKRSTSPNVSGVLLAFVPSQAPGATQGAAYSFIDSEVVPGQTYWYWLEDVNLNGATTLHGPVSATVYTPTAVTLSELSTGNQQTKAWPGWLDNLAKVLQELLAPAFSGLP